MATAGCYIAEAHVMKKLHREKVKKMEEDKRASKIVDCSESEVNKFNNSIIGCFGMFKKIHPSNNQDNNAKKISSE